MTEILQADSTTNISSLPSHERLLDNTAYPFLSAFTIDLLNLNLVCVSSHSIFLLSLGENWSKEFYLGERNFPLEHVSLYQNFAISYLTENVVVTEMVLPFADPFVDQELANYARLGFVLTANSLLHESYQPLSGLSISIGATFNYMRKL